ncbi:MAG: hypothetical protein Ct9H300mP1_22430 [Planctomycetaceae bacterium]|nr:MAG: hypothetical protein Ct9H300mP1_22430 [Planctomycetaceae bacterium]
MARRLGPVAAIPPSLQDKTRKQLAQLARRQGIPGWHPMRKAELIDALAVRPGGPTVAATRRSDEVSRTRTRGGQRGRRPTGRRADRQTGQFEMALGSLERFTGDADQSRIGPGKDWHRAKMVLRLSRITDDNEGPTSESRVRDTVVKLETGECCVEIDQPGLPYRLHLGFSIPGGKFFFPFALRLCLHAPGPAAGGKPSAEHFNHISRQFPSLRIITGTGGRGACRWSFTPPLVVYGRTAPETLIELEKDSVRVGRDGRFELRLPLENGRQFVPATATAGDRTSQRRVALAIERHLKLLDPEPTEEQT